MVKYRNNWFMSQDNRTLVLVFLIWVTLCECCFIKPILNWYNLHLRKCIAAWLVITLQGSRPLTLCLSPAPTYFIFCWFLFSENIIIKHNQTLFCSHTWFRHFGFYTITKVLSWSCWRDGWWWFRYEYLFFSDMFYDWKLADNRDRREIVDDCWWSMSNRSIPSQSAIRVSANISCLPSTISTSSTQNI